MTINHWTDEGLSLLFRWWQNFNDEILIGLSISKIGHPKTLQPLILINILDVCFFWYFDSILIMLINGVWLFFARQLHLHQTTKRIIKNIRICIGILCATFCGRRWPNFLFCVDIIWIRFYASRNMSVKPFQNANTNSINWKPVSWVTSTNSL